MEWIEQIGIVVFAMSGAFVAINKKLDLFGIIIISVTTAVGGGLLRDLILGNNPPLMFMDPSFCATAFVSGLVVILVYNVWEKKMSTRYTHFLLGAILLLDAVGLGIFTIIGCEYSFLAGYGDHMFLTAFVGTVTGVGGGVLRDVLVNRTPVILRKEIYALAAVIGAILYCYLRPLMRDRYALYFAAAVITAIRLISLRKNIHVPTVKKSRTDKGKF